MGVCGFLHHLETTICIGVSRREFCRGCLVLLFDTIHSGFGVHLSSSQIGAATSKHMIKSHNGHGSRVSSAKRRPTYRARSARVLLRWGNGVAFRNLDLLGVLHGRILGFGRLAEMLVFCLFGGFVNRNTVGGVLVGRGVGSSVWLLSYFVVSWRDGGDQEGSACLSFFWSGHTCFPFWGCISGCCGGTRFLVLLKLFQGIFSWFGFGKASGIGSGRV